MVEISLDFGCECNLLHAIWLAHTNANIRMENLKADCDNDIQFTPLGRIYTHLRDIPKAFKH
jgi:hypothetical protein